MYGPLVGVVLGVVLAPLGDLAMQPTPVQITYMPVNAPVLFADGGDPRRDFDEMRRPGPEGVGQDNGVEVYVVGPLETAAGQAREMGYRRDPGGD